MSNVDKPQDNDSPENEIESPVDGPTPDWMKMATSSSSKPSLSEDDMPDWLKDIQAGKTLGESESSAEQDESGLSDLERLLAEEGVDLENLDEERPEGAEGMSPRDWMIATSDDEMIRKRIGEEPMGSDAAVDSDTEDSLAGLSDIERLLAEEGVDLGAVAEERPEGAEGMSARDWMISTSDDEMIRKRIGAEAAAEASDLEPEPLPEADEESEAILDEDLPDWLQDAADEASDDEVFGSADDDLPDWLQEGFEDDESFEPVIDESEADDGMVVDEDLPDWLRDIDTEEEETPVDTTAEVADDKMVVDDQLPDWLRDVEEEVSSRPIVVPETADDDQTDDVDLPDWLRDVEEEVSTTLPELSPTAADTEDDKMVVEEDLPDWLQEVDDSEPETMATTSSSDTSDDQMVVEEDLPDWLREPEDEPEAPTGLDEDELPDWLQEAEEQITATPEPEPTAELFVADDSVIEEDELPDWLQEVEDDSAEDLFDVDQVSEMDEETGLDEELPDWLNQVMVEDDQVFEPSEPGPDDVDIFDDEEDLPDWLKDVQAEADETEPESEPAVELESTEIDDTDLPDWLMEVEEETEPIIDAEVEVIAEEAVAPEAIETDAAPAEVTETAAVEAEQISFEPELPAEVEAEPEVEVAEHVEEVAAPVVEPAEEAEETVEVVEVPAVAATAAVATGAMPDWLKKLREGDREEVAAVAQPAPPPPPVPKPQPVARVQSVVTPKEESPVVDDLPSDPEERIGLARIARENGNIDEAVRVYENLVTTGDRLDTVIDDVEMALRTYPANYRLHQVLGDAMMKDGRLQSALDSYRKALEKLSG